YLTPALVFTRCNAEQASCFGTTQDEVNGRSLRSVAPDYPDLLRDVERVATAAVGQPAEGRMALSRGRPNEGRHHYLVSYCADRNDAGRVRGVFMTSLDVTT